MPPSEPRATPPSGRTAPDPGQARRRGPTERRRPEPNSMLAPSPSPLMPTAGRRQHQGSGRTRQELVYLSGRVPRALRDELHIRAIEEGRPVVDLLRDAIRGYLDVDPPRS
ncbi:hypothetical protein [Actinomycetospora sp. CA-084318]|uniref:hypothetical protein n=1 Tax=Actinomycetospora sp. CA-084318 TaxID=3239892 RepID=UPI003D96898A